MKKIDLIIGTMRVPLDFILTVLALVLAYQVRLNWLELFPYNENFNPLPYSDFFDITLISGGILIAVFFLSGRYTFPAHWHIFREIKSTLFSTIAWMGVSLSMLFFFREEFFSRLIVIYALIFTFVLLVLERAVLYFLVKHLHKKGIGQERALLVGTNVLAKEVLNSFKYNPDVKIIGTINTKKEPTGKFKILGSLKDFEKIVLKNEIDLVIQTEDLPQEEALKIIEFCQINHLRYAFSPDNLALERSNIETLWADKVPLIELKGTALDGWGRVIKRMIDLFCSFFGLILLSPIFLLIAIIIKIDSPGPVFFSRLPDGKKVKRIGRNGKEINFLKFRTMRHNSHNERYTKLADKSHRKGPLVKIKNDPRVTRVGKFLRKTSIDELPQLWNVFMGELSLVGPRAHLPEEVEKYKPYQKRVFAIKPGITGLSQISGRSDLEFEDEVRLDLWYIENWSVWLDFKILIKTIGVVFGGKGAD